MPPDPHRVLGLQSNASSADIKRAYRALAKTHHPDSAGDGALPRFLAIQAAYEQLSGSKVSPPGRSGASGRSSAPWKADPARARGATGSTRGSETRTDSETGKARTRPRSAAGEAGGTAGGARRKSAKKATFGSTTYDEERNPSDPTWQGASWYGQSSGEYWTVNPREYADPRKHGPEYQARAADRVAQAAASATSAGPVDSGRARQPRTGTTSGSRAGPNSAAGTADAARAQPPPAAEGPRAQPSQASSSGLSWRTLDSGPYRRPLLALVAWPPLGIAAASVIGDATGCATFSATCTSAAQFYPWVAQAAILLALFLVPQVARRLIWGTAAVSILAAPVAFALAASGAGYDQSNGPATLFGILAVAWLGAVMLAVRRAVQARSRG